MTKDKVTGKKKASIGAKKGLVAYGKDEVEAVTVTAGDEATDELQPGMATVTVQPAELDEAESEPEREVSDDDDATAAAPKQRQSRAAFIREHGEAAWSARKAAQHRDKQKRHKEKKRRDPSFKKEENEKRCARYARKERATA